MSFVTNLGTTAKNVFNTAKNYVATTPKGELAAKGVAVIGALAVLGDVNHMGKEVSHENRIEKDADAGYDYFTNTRYLDSKSGNANHLKKALFESELNNNFRGRVSSATGYVKGAFEGLISKIIPIGLATTALVTKGKASMISAGLLAGYGAYKFITAGFGHMSGKYGGE